MAAPDLSFYLHVPFCTDKCLYCDFFSVPSHTVQPAVRDRLVNEITTQVGAFLRAAGPDRRMETAFIGGGTPSCLPTETFRRLLAAVAGLHPVEWTVEANPETLDEAFIEACADAGVTRLSVGIQSLHDDHLRFLRRRATAADCRRALALLDRRWRGDLNLDLIAGIPGQTVADVRGDIAVLDDAHPSHVSLYQLTLEAGTPLTRLVEEGAASLNPPELDETLWFAGRDELGSRGYKHYEVSNFSRPGKECRHNLRYWRLDPYLGAGPAAVSTIPAELARRMPGFPAGMPAETVVVRVANPRSVERYLAGQGAFWGAEVEFVTPRDFLLETLMMGLRLADGLSTPDFARRFGGGFSDFFPGLWEGWVERGWASPMAERLALTAEGLMVLDYLLEQAATALEGLG